MAWSWPPIRRRWKRACRCSRRAGTRLMLPYFEAKSGKTYAVDAMDAAGSVDVAAYLKRPEDDRTYGYGSVCVPGLPAGLWTAHQRWGVKKWADDIQPAIALAREGFRIL